MTFLSFVLAFMGFALLVILHELGHFSAAKAVGMRVEKFSLFFPPKLFSKKIGETEYQIGAIPAGGYVKISGMSPHEDLPPEVAPRAYRTHNPKHCLDKQAVVLAASPRVRRFNQAMRLHLRPLGVSQHESFHPKLESQPSLRRNPKSQQALVRWI